MTTKTQKQIAGEAGISESLLSLLLSGGRRPSWPTAKRLADATGTEPTLWMDGEPDQIRAAIRRVS